MAEAKSYLKPKPIKDIKGCRSGRLVAVSLCDERTHAGKAQWHCLCDCGRTSIVRSANFHKTKSCGCYNDERIKSLNLTHGLSKTQEYSAWCKAVNRCFNPDDSRYGAYGGRGITMCEEWRNSFEQFLADMGTAPKHMSIDRINNDGNYEPCNCRWATMKTQVRNRRTTLMATHNGETRPLAEWAELTGIPYSALKYRRKHGLRLF